jgi:hypothetical protein
VSVHTEPAAKPVRTAAAAAVSRLRRASMAALVLVVAEYAIGMYVNLYVAVPKADRGGSLGTAIRTAVLRGEPVHAVPGQPQ